MFIYWSYFYTSRQQRIVEIAGNLHPLSGLCDTKLAQEIWCQSVAVLIIIVIIVVCYPSCHLPHPVSTLHSYTPHLYHAWWRQEAGRWYFYVNNGWLGPGWAGLGWRHFREGSFVKRRQSCKLMT